MPAHIVNKRIAAMPTRMPTELEWREALAQIRELKNALNTTRLIMDDKQARDLAGEFVTEAGNFLNKFNG